MPRPARDESGFPIGAGRITLCNVGGNGNGVEQAGRHGACGDGHTEDDRREAAGDAHF
ncbi:hypothetical protein ACKVWC_000031 [Pyricularia oryzae]